MRRSPEPQVPSGRPVVVRVHVEQGSQPPRDGRPARKVGGVPNGPVEREAQHEPALVEGSVDLDHLCLHPLAGGRLRRDHGRASAPVEQRTAGGARRSIASASTMAKTSTSPRAILRSRAGHRLPHPRPALVGDQARGARGHDPRARRRRRAAEDHEVAGPPPAPPRRRRHRAGGARQLPEPRPHGLHPPGQRVRGRVLRGRARSPRPDGRRPPPLRRRRGGRGAARGRDGRPGASSSTPATWRWRPTPTCAGSTRCGRSTRRRSGCGCPS